MLQMSPVEVQGMAVKQSVNSRKSYWTFVEGKLCQGSEYTIPKAREHIQIMPTSLESSIFCQSEDICNIPFW